MSYIIYMYIFTIHVFNWSSIFLCWYLWFPPTIAIQSGDSSSLPATGHLWYHGISQAPGRALLWFCESGGTFLFQWCYGGLRKHEMKLDKMMDPWACWKLAVYLPNLIVWDVERSSEASVETIPRISSLMLAPHPTRMEAWWHASHR